MSMAPIVIPVTWINSGSWIKAFCPTPRVRAVRPLFRLFKKVLVPCLQIELKAAQPYGSPSLSELDH
jgi:hypothetical protein